MKKAITLLLAASMVTATLAGCASGKPAEGAGQPAEDDAPKKASLEEQMDAYWRQVLDTDQAATVRDATISSTLEFTEEDQKVQLTMISYLDDYLEVHADIPKDGLDKQNFCYSIEKI